MKALVVFCALVMAAAIGGAAEKKAKSAAGAKVVPHKQLQTLLPQMPGWTRGEPQGETIIEEVTLSRVQAEYIKGENSLTFEIIDTAMNKDLLAEMRELTKPGYSQKLPAGYVKATTIRGYPATEEWTPEARNGYLSALVSDRFVVKVSGSYVPSLETIRSGIEAFDFQKLAALK
jgi:hypothetical protein